MFVNNIKLELENTFTNINAKLKFD